MTPLTPTERNQDRPAWQRDEDCRATRTALESFAQADEIHTKMNPTNPTKPPLAALYTHTHVARLNETIERLRIERDQLKFAHDMNAQGMAVAQELIDPGRWAGFPLIEGVTAELREARETIERLTRERDRLRDNLDRANILMIDGARALDERKTQRDALNAELAKAREEIARLNAILERANPPPHRAYECLGILDAMGMGAHGCPHGNTLTGMVKEVCEKLAAANAAREKAKKELAAERLTSAGWRNEWLVINEERDDLRRQLAEAEERQSAAKILHEQRDGALMQLREALATVERMREALGRTVFYMDPKKFGDRSGKYYDADWMAVQEALSTQPCDHLRALKLELAEAAFQAAFREGWHTADGCSPLAESSHSAWLASQTCRELQRYGTASMASEPKVGMDRAEVIARGLAGLPKTLRIASPPRSSTSARTTND